MGCTSSKEAKSAVAVDVYRPPPTSFAVFDINAIKEPWLMLDHVDPPPHEKSITQVPATVLAKLNSFETEAPHSWDEVSKALEASHIKKSPPPKSAASPEQPKTVEVSRKVPRKSFSFHTLEELDAKVSNSSGGTEFKKSESMSSLSKSSSRVEIRSVKLKENPFIKMDRMEKEKEGKVVKRFNPLSDFPEKVPPNGGADSVVIYTTSLRGVRRTYDDCCRVKGIFELHRFVFDERDVSLHGEFLNELKGLLGEEDGGGGGGTSVSVPRVFVKGRYLGGAEEVSELNESGRLGRILNYARVERGVGRLGCEGCGGARFMPCLDCGGSCKVVVSTAGGGGGGDKKERCGKCNENGLVHCPICL